MRSEDTDSVPSSNPGELLNIGKWFGELSGRRRDPVRHQRDAQYKI